MPNILVASILDIKNLVQNSESLNSIKKLNLRLNNLNDYPTILHNVTLDSLDWLEIEFSGRPYS